MIVVAGEALIDRLVRVDGSVTEVPGGGPFNTARAIARLGRPVAFLGCISTDPHGQLLTSLLEADGVDTSWVAQTDRPTTVAVAHLDVRGGATYRFETVGTSAPRLDSAAVEAALATRPDILHIGALGLVLEPIATALDRGIAVAGDGTLVMVDPNVRPAAIEDHAAYVDRLVRILGRADVVKASREDLGYLWPSTPTVAAIRRMLDAGVRAVLVTDGPRPVACHTAGFAFEMPVPPVDIVDTVGAGDAFGGGFLARWTERGLGADRLADGAALRDAVSVAIGVATATCGRPGAEPPYRRDVDWPEA